MTECEICSNPVASPARGRRPRFCSTRCRVAAHRKAQRLPIPAELKERARWIRHENKRPITSDGWYCSVTNPKVWDTFEYAKASKKGDGLGFVLNGDGVVCVDLDDCVVDGVVSVEAQALIDSLPRTFVELSPSGRGLHVWGFGDVGAGRRFERDGLKVEVYGDGRYLTVTGNALVDAPLAELDLDDLVR
jgi:primase-polymerase (primpol)-like protein